MFFFLQLDLPFLFKMKTSKEYVWSNREKTSAGTSIIDLIEYGKERAKYSSDICGVLIKELKLQAKEKK
jgi:hypothetical protein